MDTSKEYTIQEIRKAFWDTFHRSGEIWFNYLGTKEENENSTEWEWDDFEKNLRGSKERLDR
jgi:hypothetical protein